MVDTIIVSFSVDDDGSQLLVVGRKPKNKPVEVINAFTGTKAFELYSSLMDTSRKEHSDDSRN